MAKSLSRRQFVRNLAAASIAFSLPGRRAWASTQRTYTPLPVPELASSKKIGKKQVFQLSAQIGEMEFIPGKPTPTLGYNGNYLGPTIRIEKGSMARIEVTNQFNEITTVHWHGMILPAAMDGGPHQKIAPQQKWISEFPVIQPAATLFYHSHAHNNTGQQVYRGLAGLLIIDDESQQLPLPREYGVDDIPVIIQDRDLADDGSLQYLRFMPERMVGKHGHTLLVNGAVSPVFKAKKSPLRLRLVNASNARFYQLAFGDNRPFHVIASDGGLLRAPVNAKQLTIAPAERYEILVDVSDRKQVMLKSFAGAGNANHGPMRMMGMDRDFDVLLIDAEAAVKSNTSVPKQLATMPDWSDKTITNQRRLELQMGMGMGMMGQGGMAGGMLRINGQSFSMERIDFRAQSNGYEIWDIGNRSPMVHPFHVHNTQFRIVGRSGSELSTVEIGLKDTVVIHQSEVVRILVPTGPYADPKNPYMFHCHILEHEDGGMMGQFTVEK